MSSRALVVAALGVFVAVVAIALAKAGVPTKRELGYGQVRFNGLGPERWAARFRAERRDVVALEAKLRRARLELRELRGELREQRRLLLARPLVVEAINLAVATYGFGSTLWRKARCETGGTFSPTAQNPKSTASGLFQFLDSTWASTPYARFSVFSPYANALAAGWMHRTGRGDEWVCQ